MKIKLEDYKMKQNKNKNKRKWSSESIYLEKVTGDKIVEEQNVINSADGMFVKATQVFPLMRNGGGNEFNNNGKPLFCAFIYYQVDTDKVSGYREYRKYNMKEVGGKDKMKENLDKKEEVIIDKEKLKGDE